MIKCPFCHFENEDGALFCEQCKSDLSDVAPTPAAPRVPPAPSKSSPPPVPVSVPPPLPPMPGLPPIAPPHLTIGSGGSFAPPPFPPMMELAPVAVEPPPFGGPPKADKPPKMEKPLEAIPVVDAVVATPVDPFAPVPVADIVEAEVYEPIPAAPLVDDVIAVVPMDEIQVPPMMPTMPPMVDPIPPPPVQSVAPPPIVPVAIAPVAPPPPTPVAVTPTPPTPAPPAAAGEGALPAGVEPTLLVMRGLKRNAKYNIFEGPNYIGRSDDKPVDIDLEDQEPADRVWCSRQHAVIHYENQRLSIEDLNSSNGTFVNRVKIYPGQIHPLKPDDVIQIGSVQMKVVL